MFFSRPYVSPPIGVKLFLKNCVKSNIPAEVGETPEAPPVDTGLSEAYNHCMKMALTRPSGTRPSSSADWILRTLLICSAVSVVSLTRTTARTMESFVKSRWGELEGRLVVVLHTARGDQVRIISMRKANAKEIHWFEKQFSAS